MVEEIVNKPQLSEDRKAALVQWNAAWTIIDCKEKMLSNCRQRIIELEKELKMVDKSEVDGLYSTIETLTNQLEELR